MSLGPLLFSKAFFPSQAGSYGVWPEAAVPSELRTGEKREDWGDGGELGGWGRPPLPASVVSSRGCKETRATSVVKPAPRRPEQALVASEGPL